MTLSIAIPTSHYAGFQIRKDDIYPLGFIVPDGSDNAARDRKATVDRWANKSKVQIPSKTFTNQPMVGFMIRKSVKHQFSNSNVEKWRIIDPRGFELEISNINMSMIIDNCIIDNGEIIDSCVWARDGMNNILLPISTDIYKQAIANTVRKNTIIKINDVKLGDHITLTNGVEARYLGKYYKATTNLYFTNSAQPEVFSYSKEKHHVLLIGNAVQSFSSLKISEIRGNQFITPNLAEELVNQKTLSGSCTNYHDTPKFFVSKPIPIDKFKMNKIKFNSLLAASQSAFNTFIAKRPNGQHMIIEKNSLTTAGSFTYNYILIDSDEYLKGNIVFETYQSTIYGMCQEGAPKYIDTTQVRNEMLEFYSAEYNAITDLGNPLSVKI